MHCNVWKYAKHAYLEGLCCVDYAKHTSGGCLLVFSCRATHTFGCFPHCVPYVKRAYLGVFLGVSLSCRPRHAHALCEACVPWGVSKVLVAIGNAGLHHLDPHIVPPVVAQLAGPLKVCGVRHIGIHQLLHHIPGMHI